MVPLPSRRPRGGRDTLEKVALLGPGLVFNLVFVVAPVLLVAAYSVAHRGRFGGVEWGFTLENFRRALEPAYLRVLVYSFEISIAATLLAFMIGYPTAWAINRLPGRWRLVALALVLIPFWTNFLIRMYAWITLLNSQGVINDALVRTGLTGERHTLLYNSPAVVVGLVYVYLPLMVLPIYASLAGHSQDLVEASIDLGASRLRSFLTVTLPLSLPGVITGCIFVLVPSLGNFVVPELLGGGKRAMVGNLVRDQFLKTQDWPFGAVLALILVAMLLMLFWLQSSVSRRLEGTR